MLVMPGANGNILMGYLAGRFPRQIGTMVSTATGWMKPHAFLPYAIDNGKYADTIAQRPWDERKFLTLLDRAAESPYHPIWVVVPDVLYDRDGTLRLFDAWAPKIQARGFKLAMACQDGMTPSDVPDGVVAFIGGSDDFKRFVPDFVQAGHITHYARLNSFDKLMQAHLAGVTSCDSTGWFRQGGVEHGKEKTRWRIYPLLRYFEWVNAQDNDPYFDLIDPITGDGNEHAEN